ncbi:MAG TPA: hypothetical protein VFX50_11495, partial [Gemmatimonadales bacterium]|nr:hypothetical protein [Gemmatimonadales bacterium]
DHARAAVSDTQIVVARAAPRRRVVAAALAGLVAGTVLGYGLAQLTAPASPAPAVHAATRPASIPPAPTPAAESRPVNPPAAVAPAAPAPPTPAPQAAPAADPIDSRAAAGRELLAPGSAARYSVQLMVTDAREREYLESYLAQAGRLVEPAKLYLVASGNPQSPRVGVLYGGYEGRAQATEALAALPVPLRQFKPYVRSVDAVREEARRAQSQ